MLPPSLPPARRPPPPPAPLAAASPGGSTPPTLPVWLLPPLPGREDGPWPAAGLQSQGREVERGGRAPGPARQHLPAAPDRPAGQRCVGRGAGPGGRRAAGGLPDTVPGAPRASAAPGSALPAVLGPASAAAGARRKAPTRRGVRALLCTKISG